MVLKSVPHSMFACLTAVSLISTCPCVTQRRSQSWLLELLVIPICHNDRQILHRQTYTANTYKAWMENLLTLAAPGRSGVSLSRPPCSVVLLEFSLSPNLFQNKCTCLTPSFQTFDFRCSNDVSEVLRHSSAEVYVATIKCTDSRLLSNFKATVNIVYLSLSFLFFFLP